MIIIFYSVYWFNFCLLRSVYHFFLCFILAGIVLAVFTRNDCMHDCEIAVLLYPVHWFVFSLLWSTFVLKLNYCSPYVCDCFYKKKFTWLFVKWLLSYIQFIDWIFNCSDLFVVVYHFNYCRKYIIGCFYMKLFLCMFLKWLLLITSSLINSFRFIDCYSHVNWTLFFFFISIIHRSL